MMKKQSEDFVYSKGVSLEFLRELRAKNRIDLVNVISVIIGIAILGTFLYFVLQTKIF